MGNEADWLWEWLPATITSRQDADPTEKNQLIEDPDVTAAGGLKTAPRAVSQGARPLGKRSISQDM
jgi:hypothetical protein